MASERDSATTVAQLAADEATARRVMDVVAESFDPLAAVAGASEDGPDRWTVAIHFRDQPNQTAVRALIALAAGADAANGLAFATTTPQDWVKASHEGLQPIEAGRFVVHTAHYRSRVPVNRSAIEIEASLAFGTGHHGTTRGCLLALDRIVKEGKKRPRITASASLAMRRTAPQRSLPPCGGGTGRGVTTNSDFAVPPSPPLPRKSLHSGRPCARPGGGGSRPSLPQRQCTPATAARNRPRAILDIGTGTGVLAI